MGSGAIIYLAALAGVDQELYEAADLDGCSRLKKIWYITLPSIMPTIVTMFLLQVGNIIRIAPDKALLLYQPTTLSVADIFGTFVYRVGLIQRSYSYAAAVGLFNTIVNLILLTVCNTVTRKLNGSSLW